MVSVRATAVSGVAAGFVVAAYGVITEVDAPRDSLASRLGANVAGTVTAAARPGGKRRDNHGVLDFSVVLTVVGPRIPKGVPLRRRVSVRVGERRGVPIFVRVEGDHRRPIDQRVACGQQGLDSTGAR